MRTRVKLLAEHEGEFLAREDSGEFYFPETEIADQEMRFEAARQLLDVEDLQDVVRLGLEDNESRDYYVVYGTVEEVPEELETFSPQNFGELSWREDDEYMIVPVKHMQDYLKDRHDYSGGNEIEVAKTVIRNSKGEILALKKSHLEKVSSGEKFKKYGEMSGKWELPGGRIGKFPSETTRFEAARREIEEETGLKLQEGEDALRIEVEEVNTVKAYMLLYDEWRGEVRLSEEHTDFRWISPDKFRKLDWHMDAGYGIPLIENLDRYMERPKDY